MKIAVGKKFKSVDELNKFDVVIDKDGELGIVKRLGYTILHNHKFVKMTLFRHSVYNDNIYEETIKYYHHEECHFTVIGNIRKGLLKLWGNRRKS